MKEFAKIPREKTENVILSRPTREGNLETTRLRVLQTPSRGIIHRRRTEVTEKKRPKNAHVKRRLPTTMRVRLPLSSQGLERLPGSSPHVTFAMREKYLKKHGQRT